MLNGYWKLLVHILLVSAPLIDINAQDNFRYTLRGNMNVSTKTNIPVALYNVNSRVYQGSPESIARSFLIEKKNVLGLTDSQQDIEYVETKQSPAGYHVVFRQKYKGVPVWRSETIISINHQNSISTVINGSRNDINIASVIPSVSGIMAIKKVKEKLGINTESVVKNNTIDLIIFQDENDFYHLAWEVNLLVKSPNGHWVAFVDAHSGDIILIKDVFIDYVQGSGRVFSPDPVTNIHQNDIHDNNNQDTYQTSIAYKDVPLNDLNEAIGGVFKVQGRYAKSEDIGEDWAAPVEATCADCFNYNRSQPGFEEVSIYYFIDKQRRYIGNLGFSPQWNGSDAISFDAHYQFCPLCNQHNASYDPMIKYMAFGEECVDAGEDQDVIIHEYGHALHDAMMGNLWEAEHDVGAISEGSSDYFANSHRLTIDPSQTHPYQPNSMAVWFDIPDCGTSRSFGSNYIYPNNWVEDIHNAGLVWGSTLKDIQTEIQSQGENGRDVTTKLLLSS
mgnify:CR=1 FL=1